MIYIATARLNHVKSITDRSSTQINADHWFGSNDLNTRTHTHTRTLLCRYNLEGLQHDLCDSKCTLWLNHQPNWHNVRNSFEGGMPSPVKASQTFEQEYGFRLENPQAETTDSDFIRSLNMFSTEKALYTQSFATPALLPERCRRRQKWTTARRIGRFFRPGPRRIGRPSSLWASSRTELWSHPEIDRTRHHSCRFQKIPILQYVHM